MTPRTSIEHIYPHDEPLWEPPTTRDKVELALESLREVYEAWLLEMNPLKPPRETALRGSYHSLLYRLWLKEKEYGAVSRPLDQILSEMEKVKLLHLMGEALPEFRPAAIAIKRVPDCDWRNDLLNMLETHKTIYVKTDKSVNGEGVFQLKKTVKGIRVMPPSGEPYFIDSVEDKAMERIIQKGVRYLLEASIPIARTEAHETWEIRCVAPFSDHHYSKIGPIGSHVNNLSQGGRIQKSETTVESVLRAHKRDITPSDIKQQTRAFLERCHAVATDALAVIHGIEDRIAVHVVTQDLISHFQGTFLLVDITGVWDEEAQTLKPIIVECQPGGSIQAQGSGELGRNCTAQINRALCAVKKEL